MFNMLKTPEANFADPTEAIFVENLINSMRKDDSPAGGDGGGDRQYEGLPNECAVIKGAALAANLPNLMEIAAKPEELTSIRYMVVD